MPCSICQKVGHNIRTCKMFKEKQFKEIQERTKKEIESDTDSHSESVPESDTDSDIDNELFVALSKCNIEDSKIDTNKLILIQSIIRRNIWYISYINNIKTLIKEMYKKKNKKFEHNPTLFSSDKPEDIKMLEMSFRQRQKDMKEGNLGQIVIGNWFGWEDLGIGHSSGLDCRKKDNSIIMELKNKYNTCNSGSREAVLNKLVEYKKINPKTRCIWAIVNANPDNKKLHKIIIHNGYEIEKIEGSELFKLVFSIANIDYSPDIINIVKDYIGLF